MMLLWCSGDVELNPGPLSGPCELMKNADHHIPFSQHCPLTVALVSDNLSKVYGLTHDGNHGWYNLGLELGLKESVLLTIKQDHQASEPCHREMLSKWLKTDPPPTWEALIAALMKPWVGLGVVGRRVKQACGLEDLEGRGDSAISISDNESGQLHTN